MKIILDYLNKTGLSQAALARDMGISPVALNHLLRGRRGAGVQTLKRLSRSTGISVERLVKSIPAHNGA